jgi:two-component system chemotaxis response regulator CheY
MKKILIVEDHEHIRIFLNKCLQREFPNYEILEAENGFDALKLIKENNDIEIMILDLMMPLIDGIYLYNRLKEKKLVNFKVLVLSAKNDDVTVFNMTENGVDDFLSKPVDKELLTSKINYLINQKQSMFPYINCDLNGFIENIPIEDNSIHIYKINEESCRAKISFEVEKSTNFLISSKDFKEYFKLDNILMKVQEIVKNKESFDLLLFFEGMRDQDLKGIRQHTISGKDLIKEFDE